MEQGVVPHTKAEQRRTGQVLMTPDQHLPPNADRACGDRINTYHNIEPPSRASPIAPPGSEAMPAIMRIEVGDVVPGV